MPAKYRKLTPEILADIASQHNNRRAFYDADPSAYVSARRRKIVVDGKEISLLDHICAHMYRKKFQWTPEMIKNVSAKYQTRTAFAQGDKAAYAAAQRQGILDDVCTHMKKDQRSVWTEAKLKSLVNRFGDLETIRKKSPAGYKAIKKMGLEKELFA